ncbi:MAG TPA: DUF1175 family protein [Vicinamibacterales bacterium]|nr:DUF1175 family protein [Vicinamibacterales bacterium]
MHRLGAAVVAALVTFSIGGGGVSAQVRLADESDRAAFRAWFVLLADAQFERQTEDVNDCAALVRHAVREALRTHTPEWVRRSGLPFTPQFADVRSAPRAGSEGLPLFRISADATPKFAEFADAKTLINLNAKPLGRDAHAARPGDLLYFRQPGQREPDHLMVFVGRSHFETEGDDWVVYHTGPGSQGVGQSGSQGEVRKVRLSTLMQHPAPRWRPLGSNPNFVGVFRLVML